MSPTPSASQGRSRCSAGPGKFEAGREQDLRKREGISRLGLILCHFPKVWCHRWAVRFIQSVKKDISGELMSLNCPHCVPASLHERAVSKDVHPKFGHLR